MQKIVNLIIGTTLLAAVSCGTANKDGKPELYSKKIRLDSLKAQQAKLNAEIARLESEIANNGHYLRQHRQVEISGSIPSCFAKLQPLY